jgi:hypothetical protein
MVQSDPADARQRRLAILIVLVGLVTGVVALLLIEARFEEIEGLIERDLEAGTAALVKTIRWLIVFLVVPMACFLGYLGWFALRVIRGARFPPLGTHILRSTAVLEGRSAVVRGWLIAFVTLLVALAVVQLAITLWTLAGQITRDARVAPPPSIETAPL